MKKGQRFETRKYYCMALEFVDHETALESVEGEREERKLSLLFVTLKLMVVRAKKVVSAS